MSRYLFCTESNAAKYDWGSLANNPHSTDLILDNEVHCWTLKCPAFVIYVFYRHILEIVAKNVYFCVFHSTKITYQLFSKLNLSLHCYYWRSMLFVLCDTVLYNVQVYRFCEFQLGH